MVVKALSSNLTTTKKLKIKKSQCILGKIEILMGLRIFVGKAAKVELEVKTRKAAWNHDIKLYLYLEKRAL
jgi:hypothetical protein